MAYDQKLADRIRALVAGRPGVSEKAMFGGLAFLLDGRMFCGVNKDDLMVRAGPARHDEALAKPHARSMDFTGRPMKGYVFVGAEGAAPRRCSRHGSSGVRRLSARLHAAAVRPGRGALDCAFPPVGSVDA